MSEADVVYSDIRITKDRRKANGDTSSPADTTYSEVNILKKQPSKGLPDSQQQRVSDGQSGVTCERVALAVLSAFLVVTVIILSLTAYENIHIMERLKKLEGELDALNKNHTGFNSTVERCEVKSCNNTMPQECPEPPIGKNDSCPSCEEGWVQHGEKCYYFSNDRSAWEESRNKCRGQGGDLVKIESTEEQKFLMLNLREKMDRDEDKFWIGLTDSKKENTWLWADGSPLNPSLTLWSGEEPDNWDGENKRDGEDCVRMGEKNYRENVNSWLDKDCGAHQRRICDKPARPRYLKCV